MWERYQRGERPQTFVGLRLAMSDSLLQSANSLLQLGRSPEALTWYESYLKSHPESAEAWHNHGIALSQMQRFPEAVASFDKVLALRPDSAQTWSSRGNALFEQKRYEEAICGLRQGARARSRVRQRAGLSLARQALVLRLAQSRSRISPTCRRGCVRARASSSRSAT